MREAANVGDGAGGEDRPAARVLVEDHVGADRRREPPVGARERHVHLLVDELEGVGVLLRRGHHERPRRRAEAGIEGVELETGGATAREAEVAQDLVVHTVEDEARAWIPAGGGAPVVGRAIEALGHEAHAGQRVGRAPLTSPQPAVLAGRAVIVLAGRFHPGARAVLGATHLDHPGVGGGIRHPPVEAVAAHVHEPPTAPEVGRQRVQHLPRVVLGMAAGEDDPIVREQRQAFGVQIVVGDDVVRLPLGFQPVEQTEIEEQVPQPAGGPGVDDRPPARDVAHAGAVGVRVVGGAAQLGVIHQQQIGRIHDGQRTDEQLGRARAHAPAIVRVGEVGGGGGQERHRRAWPAPRRTHVEHDPEVGAALGLQLQRVDAAAGAGRDDRGEARAPAGVVEIVVVEVDRTPLRGRPAPVHLGAVPVVAGDRALGRIHGAAVQVVGRAVGHTIAADVSGKIPETERVRRRHVRARRRRGGLQLGRRERAAGQARPVDLAVEVPRGSPPAVLDRLVGGADEERAGWRRLSRERRGDGGGRLEARRVVGERCLTQRDRVRHQVDRRAHVIPAPGGQRHARRDDRAAVQERQRAGLVEHQREAGAPILRPRAHDDLPRRRGPDRHAGGLDERLHGEARQAAERLGVVHDHVRAGVDGLGRAGVVAVDRRRQVDRLEAGALRSAVATHHPDDLRAIAPGPVEGADHEADLLAGRDAERLGVAEHARHGDAHGHSQFLTRDRRAASPGR